MIKVTGQVFEKRKGKNSWNGTIFFKKKTVGVKWNKLLSTVLAKCYITDYSAYVLVLPPPSLPLLVLYLIYTTVSAHDIAC